MKRRASLDDINIIRSYQLALLGIIWTAALPVPDVEQMISFADTDLFWDGMARSTHNAILKWIRGFKFRSQGNPKALISANIWGFVIRELILSIESSCGHSDEEQLECIPEYKTSNVSALGAKFYTDFVFMCGCSGLPLFFVELAVNSAGIHKDLKKLAVQMAGTLFQLIGIISMTQNSDIMSFLPSLRVFGALISGSNIEFAVSRPVFSSDGKFKIVFETHSDKWSFNIFKESHKSSEESHVSSNDVTIESPVDDPMDFDYADIFDEPEDSIEEPSDEIKNPETINMTAVKAVAFFINHVHSYYSSLPAPILDIYLNPIKYEAETGLRYPPSILEEFKLWPKSLVPGSGNNRKMDFAISTHQDIPTGYCFATLPSIYHMEPSSVGKQRLVWYYHGISLPQVEHLIYRNKDDEEQMIFDRVHTRSRMILGILMAIYKAFQVGIIFTKFEIEDFTYKNGNFASKPTETPRNPLILRL